MIISATTQWKLFTERKIRKSNSCMIANELVLHPGLRTFTKSIKFVYMAVFSYALIEN